MTAPEPDSRVTRRKVFYIPGYDPLPPRRYRELYRSEGAEQARISGYQIDLKPGAASPHYSWQVRAEMDGVQTASEIEILVWSDIVRESMSNSIAATYWQLLRTAWVYLSTGALLRLMRLRKGPIIAALYPVGALLLQACVAALVLLSAVWLGAALWPGPGAWLGALLGAALGYALLRWFKARDGRYFVYYLMHDYAYSAASGGANPPELEARMATFRERIAAALQEDWDEVLVVGHSSGAHLGVSILADLITENRAGSKTTLSFLSLGQVVPMVSFLPQAQRLRRDLRSLSTSDALSWVDVSAPGDGCAFALCDPVAVSGVAPPKKRWPLVLSAAFTQTLSPARWAELRWRFFRLHFQYLCAFDRPGDYDYFRITAGPLTLAARFAGRAPSASRIEAAVNRFTNTA